jgi:signal transduction histidine kinase
MRSTTEPETSSDLRGLTRRSDPANRIALTVALTFVAAGLGWVLATGALLYRVAEGHEHIARIETTKEAIFVGVAGFLLYLVALRSARRLTRVWRLTAAVIESIADGVLILSPDREIGHANPAAVRMLRCSPGQLIGMGAEEFSRTFHVSYPTGALVPPMQYVSQRVFEEEGPLRYKAVLYPPGGDPIVTNVTAAGVRLKLDEPASWAVSVMHDITAVDSLERMRDRFFAAAAHSLKTPVAIIKTDAQALAKVVPPKLKGVAASLERQSDRIDRLVQNLMVLARARTGTLELHPVVTDVGPLIEAIAREPVWSHRHEVDAEVVGSPRVFADPERLGLVIRNLMHEASRLAVHDSALKVQAGVEGEKVAIAVRFRPLDWHEHASDVYAEYDDIGIGRSVATTIVEAHGGSLSEDVTDSEVVEWIRLPSPAGVSA